MATTCTHLDQIRQVEPRTPEGCEECLKTGDRWVHLRLCLTCGHVGCCDSSPNKHATKHFHATQHPIIQSFEPDEDWSWCYVDQVILDPTEVEAATNAREGHGVGGLLSEVLDSPYTRNYVVGVVDDEHATETVVEALRRDGFTDDDVVVQTGRTISERLKQKDIGNLVRAANTDEASICRELSELSDREAVLAVHTRTPEEAESVPDIMKQHGAHSLKYVGDDEIIDVESRARNR